MLSGLSLETTPSLKPVSLSRMATLLPSLMWCLLRVSPRLRFSATSSPGFFNVKTQANFTLFFKNSNGFSVAITCSCYGTVVTGCNKNLFLLNTCPDNDGENACINPTRSSTTITTPSVFFAPCEHAAYTYPIDNAANSWGACQSGQITCCVGMACPPNQNQPAWMEIWMKKMGLGCK